ncbi:2,3-bisphosphoglycerate-dependent phosphoglycerate mutase [Choanephora cucurbitarum]|uniref:2,3-bisphosphoglycerate-dependent phosphoglycerate mutase n=1 Tax=Choanephora cucurbitarum TaxID=101091 RepID=A0A1C7ND25_9FUNG|nr:2,3-bisphosphoglycerate-dependent phosphoglycerate mutase [Choanephora cucurbitarum]
MPQPAYNHLPGKLKNHYIIQRHGFSLANNAGLICSNPDIAIPPTGGPLNTGYGLHEKGKAQVKESATLLSKHLFPSQEAPSTDDAPVVMFCSPFKRTVETAEIIQGVLNDTVLKGKVDVPIREMELRERWYGELDMKSDKLYEDAWVDDKAEPDHGENSQYGVEAPSSVCDRVTRFIVDKIESQMEGKTVILVAHGDVCQITLTAFLRIEAWRHREIKHVDTANWRDTLQIDM